MSTGWKLLACAVVGWIGGCSSPCAKALSAEDAAAIVGKPVEADKGYIADGTCNIRYTAIGERAYLTVGIEAKRSQSPGQPRTPKPDPRRFTTLTETRGDGYEGLLVVTEFTAEEERAADERSDAVLEDAKFLARERKAQRSSDPMGAALSELPMDLHEVYLDTGTWRVKLQFSRYTLQPDVLEGAARSVGRYFADNG